MNTTTTLDITGHLLVGIVLASISLLATLRKYFAFDFGRIGFFNPKSLFRVQLTQARAILFGMVSLATGLALIGLCLFLPLLPANINQNQGLLTLATVLGSGLTIFTFLLELFIEYLVQLKRRSKNKIS